MESYERRRLDILALCTIVLALGTFVNIVVDLRTTFTPVLPAGFMQVFLALIGGAALYYAILAVVKYHQK